MGTKPDTWGRNTKKGMIRDAANEGLTKREVFARMRPLVESQIKPMVFSANAGGHRIPKSIAEQLVDLKNEIGRTFNMMGRSNSASFEAEEIEPIESGTEPEPEIEAEEETDEEQTKPVAKGKEALRNSLREFLRRVREIRAFCDERAAISEKVDSISMRPAQAAAKLIPAGIPVNALLAAMTLHWPEDVRRDARIEDFDFIALSQSIMAERGITEIERSDGDETWNEIPHALFGYALVLAENRQPIMLIGPAGTGKSHLAAQLADFLSVRYGETPMSPGATRGDLLGRHTIGGFISSEFVELYGGGGVFNFEEIDAADASMLIVLNNALASKRLYNSASGEMVTKHRDFIPMATANTFGLGSNRDYTARERLDAATIDRWRMGRIFVPLDQRVEESILGVSH